MKFNANFYPTTSTMTNYPREIKYDSHCVGTYVLTMNLVYLSSFSGTYLLIVAPPFFLHSLAERLEIYSRNLLRAAP